MIDGIQQRLQQHERFLVGGVIIVGFLFLEAAIGPGLQTLGSESVTAGVLALVGVLAVLGKMELSIALLAALSMHPNPTVLDVQGRRIDVIHLLGALIVLSWFVRRLLVQRNLRPPRCHLNAPLLTILLIWLVSWLVGYILWDPRIPTDHRQPLFFVAEFGQLLLFVGVFWAVVDTVRSEGWAKIICVTIIVANASTVLSDQLGWNQTPVALALACSLLAFGGLGLRAKVGLWAISCILLWGMIGINRIPVYLGAALVVLVVGCFQNRRFLSISVPVLVTVGVVFIKPLWDAEESVPHRFELARGALSIFRDHPFLGIGPTHYRSYAILYHRNLAYGFHTVESGMLLPHDVWLYFLANVGVVGFLGILWLTAVILRESYRSFLNSQDRISRVLAVSSFAAMAGVLVQSVGGHMGFLPDYNLASFYMAPLWILLGLQVAQRQAAINAC